MNSVKNDTKNSTYYFFDDKINIKNLDLKKIFKNLTKVLF